MEITHQAMDGGKSRIVVTRHKSYLGEKKSSGWKYSTPLHMGRIWRRWTRISFPFLACNEHQKPRNVRNHQLNNHTDMFRGGEISQIFLFFSLLFFLLFIFSCSADVPCEADRYAQPADFDVLSVTGTCVSDYDVQFTSAKLAVIWQIFAAASGLEMAGRVIRVVERVCVYVM